MTADLLERALQFAHPEGGWQKKLVELLQNSHLVEYRGACASAYAGDPSGKNLVPTPKKSRGCARMCAFVEIRGEDPDPKCANRWLEQTQKKISETKVLLCKLRPAPHLTKAEKRNAFSNSRVVRCRQGEFWNDSWLPDLHGCGLCFKKRRSGWCKNRPGGKCVIAPRPQPAGGGSVPMYISKPVVCLDFGRTYRWELRTIIKHRLGVKICGAGAFLAGAMEI